MVCFRNHTQEATEAMSTTDNRRVARMLTTLCLQRHIHRLRLVFVQNVFGLVIAIDMATKSSNKPSPECYDHPILGSSSESGQY
jgi:hypothetical protein